MTKSILARIALGLVALLVLIAAYYTVEVLHARRITPNIISSALRSNSMVLHRQDLSPEQVRTILLVQDPRFFRHKGWDFPDRVTTITQALVKIYYFHPFRPGIQKIKQSLIARFALDPLVSKEDQLTLFLNAVYLGTINGVEITGLETGAEHYFHKPFRQLGRSEFLALVAMFSSPNQLDPLRHADQNRMRVQAIERLLAANKGYQF